MVERYQQDQLASQVVGTPGLDTSAGVGSKQIAQAADAMRNAENQMAMQNIAQAEQNFNRAGSLFASWSNSRAYDKRMQQAQENENRRQQVQFDLQDESDLMSAELTAFQQQFADNPREAMGAFQAEIPRMRAEFERRYSDDPKRLRMVMGSYRQNEKAAANQLKSWANQTEKANLEGRLALMPEQLSDRISNMSGSIKDQLKGFQDATRGANAIYDDLRLRAPTQGEHDHIALKQINLNKAAGKDFLDHLLSQTPEGEAGMSHLNDISNLLGAASQNGLKITPDQQKHFQDALVTARNGQERTVIEGVQGESALRVLDANRAKFALYQAADNPAEMAKIARDINNRMTDLDQQIALVAKEPDSKIKNAKLTGLKQQQAAFISETGQELKQQRQFDQLQRTLTSFAQSQIRFGQSQISFAHGMTSFAQGQERYAQWQKDLLDRNDKKAAAAIHTEEVDKFNKTWAGVQNKIKASWALPTGPKQKEAMQNIAKETLPILQNALMNGTVSGDGYKSHLDALSEALEKSSLHKVTQPGWFGIGGGQVVPLKDAKEKDKATMEAKAQFGQIVARQQTNFVHQENAVKQLHALTTGKAENAFLTQYVNTHLPKVLNSSKFQNLSSDQQSKIVTSTVMNAVKQFREKTLR